MISTETTEPCCKAKQDAGLANIETNIEKELLEVLDDPSLPLHNNLSESQIREHVKRRKISRGTQAMQGEQSRDTRFFKEGQPEEDVSPVWSLFFETI